MILKKPTIMHDYGPRRGSAADMVKHRWLHAPDHPESVQEPQQCGATVTAFNSGESENGDVDRLPRGIPRDSRGKAFKCCQVSRYNVIRQLAFDTC